MELSPDILKGHVQLIARNLGFADCRIARVSRAEYADAYLQWIKEGKHASMEWLARNQNKRTNPQEILPDSLSIISLATSYFTQKEQPNPHYAIARYAWNDDYHKILENKLKEFNLALEQLGGVQRYYSDTGPILERNWANTAGLGWTGKSCLQIHRKLGNFFFLSEIITTLDLPPDNPSKNFCGKCTRCIDICPTNAITAPWKLDARRCLSYWSIEHRGSIPEKYRRAMGNRLYGCDECLAVCPWNKHAKKSKEAGFHWREKIFKTELADFLLMKEEEFQDVFRGSPIKRIKLEGFLRNVCIVLGNKGTERDIEEIRKVREGRGEVVRESAEWGIEEIERRLRG